MASKTILIIDGDDGFARSLGAEAEARGFSALTTGSSADGLELAHSNRPDLIVVNVELTPTNGWSVCTRLKKDETLAHIPVILTSSTSTPDTFEKHRRLRTRADEYFLKPFSADDLLRTASALLGLPESGIPESPQDFSSDSSFAPASEPLHEDLVIEDESLSLGDFESPLEDDLLSVAGDEPFSLGEDEPLEELGALDDTPHDASHDDPLNAFGGDAMEIEPVAADPFDTSESGAGELPDSGFGDALELNAPEAAAIDELGVLDSLGEEQLSADDLSALDAGDEPMFNEGGFAQEAGSGEGGADDTELVSEDDLQVFDDAFDQLSGKIPIDGSDGVIEGGQYDGSGFDSGPEGDPLASFDDDASAVFDPLSESAMDGGGELDAPELLSMSDISELSMGGSPEMASDGHTGGGSGDGFAAAEPVEEHQVEAIDWEENGAESFGTDDLGADGFDTSVFGSNQFGSDELDDELDDAFGDPSASDPSARDTAAADAASSDAHDEPFDDGTSADATADSSDGVLETGEPSLGFESELDSSDGSDFLADSASLSADDAAIPGADDFAAPSESDSLMGSNYGDPAVFAELEARIAELEAELEGYRTSDSGRDQELERLNGELRTRDAELLESRNQQLEKDRIIHELRESESRLNMELARARDERVRREATVKALVAKAEQMATQARRLEREVARSRENAERITALEAERDSLNARLAELEAAREERDSLRTTVDELTARTEAAEARAKSLDDKLSRARESLLGALGS